jgi:hypothetical protein
MERSKTIAGIVGPVLMAVAPSEALHMDIWAARTAPLTYLNGMLLFIAGVAILRAHNVWAWRWSTLLTLIGWLLLAAGLYRMFFPNAPQGGTNVATYAGLALLFAVGVVLTAKAYARD